MPSYVLPQVLVFQEFRSAPAAVGQPLTAVILGEQFELHRYSEADEKDAIKVSDVYDSAIEQCFAWPGRPAGGVVDETYTRVYMEDALLKYFNDPSGDGSVITHVGPGKNRIKAQSKVFATGNGFSRSAGLLRDVKAGDAVKIVASACAEPVTFYTSVVDLLADTIAAIVDAATADVDNQTALSAAATGGQTAGAYNSVVADVIDGSTYDGLDEGDPAEIYTVDVIGASVGGDATTAILRVRSASGNDDVATVTPAAFGAPTEIGTRGLQVTFVNTSTSSSSTPGVDSDDFLIGQTFTFEVAQSFTPAVPSSGGIYNGAQDTTYMIEVTRGGKFSSSVKPQITVSTTTGIDISGPTTVTATLTAVAVGTQGVTVSFSGAGLNKGDRYFIPVIASADGAKRTLILAHNLPEGLTGECGSGSSSSSGPAPDLDLTLYIQKNIEVPENRVGAAPLVNWEQSETEICIKGGITAYDAEWASGGVMEALPVEDGAIYVQHRDRLSDWCNTVGTISDVSSVDSVLGTVDPDNPLAFGVYKALLNSNGESVKFVGVCSSSPVTLADWLAALEILVGRDDVYSVVPLTRDKDVLDAVLAHCEAQSTPENGRWRIAWLNMAASEIKAIVTVDEAGDPVLATITDDPDTSGTQYTLVESTGASFLTDGVRARDTLRARYTSDGFGNFTYSEYVVDAVINEETIRLVSGPTAAVNIPAKIEIHRTLTKTELATELATYPGLFYSRRAYLVWPDQIGNAGETFPGYFLCAGLAGLRSGVLPHQGLTNVEVQGFDDLSRTVDFFSANQLNVMAASGYWIVTQDPNDGQVYTRHQLSTGDQSDLNYKEQSITTNFDEISMGFLDRMKPYIGRGNATRTMLDILYGEILAEISLKSNRVLVDRLGPQIVSAQVLELVVHPTLRDRILCRINIDMPYPFNNMELHLIA